MKALRRRSAGLPENAYREGALRGRVALGQKTSREVIAEVLALMTAAEPP